MSEAELMYECQVCYKPCGESKLIAVEGIKYSHLHRVFPWLICQVCVKKIVYAIKELYESEEGKNE